MQPKQKKNVAVSPLGDSFFPFIIPNGFPYFLLFLFFFFFGSDIVLLSPVALIVFCCCNGPGVLFDAPHFRPTGVAAIGPPSNKMKLVRICWGYNTKKCHLCPMCVVTFGADGPSKGRHFFFYICCRQM